MKMNVKLGMFVAIMLLLSNASVFASDDATPAEYGSVMCEDCSLPASSSDDCSLVCAKRVDMTARDLQIENMNDYVSCSPCGIFLYADAADCSTLCPSEIPPEAVNYGVVDVVSCCDKIYPEGTICDNVCTFEELEVIVLEEEQEILDDKKAEVLDDVLENIVLPPEGQDSVIPDADLGDNSDTWNRLIDIQEEIERLDAKDIPVDQWPPGLLDERNAIYDALREDDVDDGEIFGKPDPEMTWSEYFGDKAEDQEVIEANIVRDVEAGCAGLEGDLLAECKGIIENYHNHLENAEDELAILIARDVEAGCAGLEGALLAECKGIIEDYHNHLADANENELAAIIARDVEAGCAGLEGALLAECKGIIEEYYNKLASESEADVDPCANLINVDALAACRNANPLPTETGPCAGKTGNALKLCQDAEDKETTIVEDTLESLINERDLDIKDECDDMTGEERTNCIDAVTARYADRIKDAEPEVVDPCAGLIDAYALAACRRSNPLPTETDPCSGLTGEALRLCQDANADITDPIDEVEEYVDPCAGIIDAYALSACRNANPLPTETDPCSGLTGEALRLCQDANPLPPEDELNTEEFDDTIEEYDTAQTACEVTCDSKGISSDECKLCRGNLNDLQDEIDDLYKDARDACKITCDTDSTSDACEQCTGDVSRLNDDRGNFFKDMTWSYDRSLGITTYTDLIDSIFGTSISDALSFREFYTSWTTELIMDGNPSWGTIFLGKEVFVSDICMSGAWTPLVPFPGVSDWAGDFGDDLVNAKLCPTGACISASPEYIDYGQTPMPGDTRYIYKIAWSVIPPTCETKNEGAEKIACDDDEDDDKNCCTKDWEFDLKYTLEGENSDSCTHKIATYTLPFGKSFRYTGADTMIRKSTSDVRIKELCFEFTTDSPKRYVSGFSSPGDDKYVWELVDVTDSYYYRMDPTKVSKSDDDDNVGDGPTVEYDDEGWPE